LIFPVCPGWPIFPSLWLAWAPPFLPQFSLIFEFQVFLVAKVQFTLLTPLDSVFKLELSHHLMPRFVSWYQIGLFWCQLASMITISHLRCLYRILAHTKASPLSLFTFSDMLLSFTVPIPLGTVTSTITSDHLYAQLTTRDALTFVTNYSR